MTWLLFTTFFFAIALGSITAMRCSRSIADQLTYAVAGIAAIFLSAHSFLAFAR